MSINFANFVTNIPYMLKGMLGLFIALGAIALSIILLNKLSDKQ
ncbi:MAG: hypothetical protein Q4E33_00305 [Erysipelotrichaceae bacterium]|nr:hypothetical protein [Erysipelotrichaceae bacterium]